MGNNTEPEAGTGLSDSFKSNEQLSTTDTGPVIDNSGQIHRNTDEKPIDFSNFNTTERTIPTLSNTAEDGQRYYNQDLHYNAETGEFEPHQNAQKAPETASYMVATKKEETPRDLHKEALDKNKKANEGFIPLQEDKDQSMRKALGVQDAIAELAKKNTELQAQNDELKNRLNSLETKIDILIAKTQPLNPDIQNALDPNNPNKVDYDKPFKDIYGATVKEANKQQEDFISQVKEEDKLHNPLNPENNKTTETEVANKKIEDEKKAREIKKATIVATAIGAGVGFTVGIVGGAAVAGTVAMVCGATILTGEFGKWRMNRLQTRIDAAQGEEKEKLEKRRAIWDRICGFVDKARPYLMGAGIGAVAAGLLSNAFLGSHGIFNSNLNGTPLNGGAGSSTSTPNGIEKPISTTSPTGTGFDSGLIQDGHVNLPGSAWDGNLATAPQANPLAGGELNASNFAGGATNMGAYNLDKVLDAAHISVSQIQNVGGDVHRLLNIYQGNPSANLAEALKQVGAASLAPTAVLP